MKNLILLLTSLLLAGAANAGIAEFATDNTQVEGWQDFQVAHLCGVHRVHVGGGHDYNWGAWKHRTKTAQCAKKEWIEHCKRENKPLDTSRGGFTCVEQKCRAGYKVDDSANGARSYQCVYAYCPEDTAWQSQHLRCVAFSVLERYCESQGGKVYDRALNECKTKCPPDHSWQKAHNKCLPFSDLGRYCKGLGKVYSPVSDKCEDACFHRTPDQDSVCR